MEITSLRKSTGPKIKINVMFIIILAAIAFGDFVVDSPSIDKYQIMNQSREAVVDSNPAPASWSNYEDYSRYQSISSIDKPEILAIN